MDRTKSGVSDHLTKKQKMLAIGITVLSSSVLIAVTTALILVLTKKAVSSSQALMTTGAVCPASSRVPIYIHVDSDTDYAFVSTSSNESDAIVQNEGHPACYLCKTAGDGRVGIYKYVNTNDGLDNRWGTSTTVPTGYALGNGGDPVGYAFTSHIIGGQALAPLYEIKFDGDADTHSGLLGKGQSVYGGHTYKVIKQLGYVI